MSTPQALGTLIAIPLIATIANVLRQILFKDPRQPPEVFHLLPLIGSTLDYGIDPYAFFFKCREKVCRPVCNGCRLR